MPTVANMLRADKFNFDAFKIDLKAKMAERGVVPSDVSQELLTRAPYYLSSVFCKKAMPLSCAMALCKEFGLRLPDYEIKPEPPKRVQIEIDVQQHGKGWENTLSVNVGAGIVSLAFFKDGQKVASGRAKIFDNTDHGIMQAISYAAHMCYKFSEQRELFVQNQSNTVGGVCKITNNTGNTSTSRR